MLSMILAIDKNLLIGNTATKNGLPWHYKEDLEYYKNNTINKKNIMGRKTFEKIGRALPNRESYVLTQDKNIRYDNTKMLHSIQDIIDLNESNLDQEIMIIGGVKLFKEIFSYVEKIYLTKIDDIHAGDIYYKDFSTKNFQLIDSYFGKNKKLKFEIWQRHAF